jgi:hypothetical protein
MSDSKRYNSTNSENIRGKFQKFIHGKVQRQNYSATVAPMQRQAMLISHFMMHILIKVSKTGGTLA